VLCQWCCVTLVILLVVTVSINKKLPICTLISVWKYSYTTCYFSGPILATILCHENAIGQWRMMLGNTKVYRYYNYSLSITIVQYRLCCISSLAWEVHFFIIVSINNNNNMLVEIIWQIALLNIRFKLTWCDQFIMCDVTLHWRHNYMMSFCLHFVTLSVICDVMGLLFASAVVSDVTRTTARAFDHCRSPDVLLLVIIRVLTVATKASSVARSLKLSNVDLG